MRKQLRAEPVPENICRPLDVQIRDPLFIRQARSPIELPMFSVRMRGCARL